MSFHKFIKNEIRIVKMNSETIKAIILIFNWL